MGRRRIDAAQFPPRATAQPPTGRWALVEHAAQLPVDRVAGDVQSLLQGPCRRRRLRSVVVVS
ncbi:hypothetical protein, partial [Mycobacterium kyogaense]|uniref:hypothetical protein n=1 Tax=Mycobacterium kyogaense TaxID=2212479 RepID=UPI003FA592C9